MNITHEQYYVMKTRLSVDAIINMVRENPNDKVLGSKIRKLVNNYDKNSG